MSDWIERLKEDKEREKWDAAEIERGKQRKHELLKSLVPDFLRETAESVERDVEMLRKTFPDDSRYHLDFRPEPPGFVLSSADRHSKFEIRFSLEEHRTIIRRATRLNHAGWEKPDNRQELLPTSLDANDQLRIQFIEVQYGRPDALAEAIVKLALKQAGV